ncbi:threonylcarbamoyl-AMP synthase [Adhaeribacter aerolatus]|uniref:Threonylcarbamoyl-AMP synthase n=1 Tax=Adhaeribacter aerolatus TaxID=670289 RepID=A0A512ATT9_9BACT|nr:L-threonylcarbamoyladenylate synthase [Adhaeribacter aerolatus]GEO02997.1 threonylcarbamoyl-AMP synthase [Adhaeribacter aerolatus]
MAELGTDILKAATLLKQQELVAIPTETVYGLAANAFNEGAVLKIFAAKNRPSFDPLIVHTHSIQNFTQVATNIPDMAYRLAEAFLPGPLTLILPRAPQVPLLVTSGHDSVGVRIPNHPLTLRLLKELPFPLAAPSANPFGYVSPTTAQHVNQQLGDRIPYILDGGACQVGIESTIISFAAGEPEILRLGGLALEEIEKVLGKSIQRVKTSSSNPQAPGMLSSHYAPRKKVLVGNIKQLLPAFDPEKIGILSFSETYARVPQAHQVQLSATGNVFEAARNLFSGLRYLDAQPVEVILAEFVPEEGLGRAVNDRLRRAAF